MKIVEGLRIVSKWDDNVGFVDEVDEKDLDYRIEFGKKLIGSEFIEGNGITQDRILVYKKYQELLKSYGFYQKNSLIWFYCGPLYLNEKEKKEPDWNTLSEYKFKIFVKDLDIVLLFRKEEEVKRMFEFLKTVKLFDKKELFIYFDKEEESYIARNVTYYNITNERKGNYYIKIKENKVYEVYFYTLNETGNIIKIDCK